MEKLTIYQLTKYYVERYGLPTDNRAGTSANGGDGMLAYQMKIKRLLEDAHVGEKSLYDAMVPEDGGTRVISLEEFEKYCLDKLVKYVQDNYSFHHNESVLIADMDRWQLEHDRAYWDKKAEAAVAKQNQAYYDGYIDDDKDDGNGEIYVTKKDLRDRGHGMMVEALYDLFFDSFNWDKLEADMIIEDSLSGSSVKPEFTGDNMRARERLKSYLNYIGKKK